DRASMAVSLESRCPLLDYRIAELMARAPAEVRYRGRVKKYLLKRTVAGRLPAGILQRGKMGFGVPLKHWFRKGSAEFTRDVLLSSAARQRGFFRTDEVERLLDVHAQGRRDFSSKIWALLFFEMWCREWLDQPVRGRRRLRRELAAYNSGGIAHAQPGGRRGDECRYRLGGGSAFVRSGLWNFPAGLSSVRNPAPGWRCGPEPKPLLFCAPVASAA